MDELYLQLFFNSILGNFFFPLAAGYMFPAMVAFGNFNNALVLAAGILGNSFGLALNYALGWSVIYFLSKKPEVIGARYDTAKTLFNSWLIFLLPFSWLNILIVLTFAAGIFKTRFPVFIALASIGEIIHLAMEYRHITSLPF